MFARPPPRHGLKNSLPLAAKMIWVTLPSPTGKLLAASPLPLIDNRLTAPIPIPQWTSLIWVCARPAARPTQNRPSVLTGLLLTYISTVLKPWLVTGRPLGRMSTLLCEILTLLLSATAMYRGGNVQLSLLLHAMTSPIPDAPLEGKVTIALFP